MDEPNPNKYKNIQNYIQALKNYWAQHGGPANQNRAIAIRLQKYWNEQHMNKMNMKTEMKNIGREIRKAFPNSNNSSNSNSNGNRWNQNITGLAKNLRTISKQYSNSVNRLNKISQAISHQLKKPKLTYRMIRNRTIPKEKANIRRKESERVASGLHTMVSSPSKLTGRKVQLSSDLIKKILNMANIPTNPMMVIAYKKNGGYFHPKVHGTPFYMYQTPNGTYWFQNYQGRWYRMNNKNNEWYYSVGSKKWIKNSKKFI